MPNKKMNKGRKALAGLLSFTLLLSLFSGFFTLDTAKAAEKKSLPYKLETKEGLTLPKSNESGTKDYQTKEADLTNAQNEVDTYYESDPKMQAYANNTMFQSDEEMDAYMAKYPDTDGNGMIVIKNAIKPSKSKSLDTSGLQNISPSAAGASDLVVIKETDFYMRYATEGFNSRATYERYYIGGQYAICVQPGQMAENGASYVESVQNGDLTVSWGPYFPGFTGTTTFTVAEQRNMSRIIQYASTLTDLGQASDMEKAVRIIAEEYVTDGLTTLYYDTNDADFTAHLPYKAMLYDYAANFENPPIISGFPANGKLQMGQIYTFPVDNITQWTTISSTDTSKMTVSRDNAAGTISVKILKSFTAGGAKLSFTKGTVTSDFKFFGNATSQTMMVFEYAEPTRKDVNVQGISVLDLKLVKTSQITHAPLVGAVFKITHVPTGESQTFTTDAKGEIYAQYIDREGDFRIEEISTPNFEHKLMAPKTVNLVGSDQTYVFDSSVAGWEELDNAPVLADLELKKLSLSELYKNIPDWAGTAVMSDGKPLNDFSGNQLYFPTASEIIKNDLWGQTITFSIGDTVVTPQRITATGERAPFVLPAKPLDSTLKVLPNTIYELVKKDGLAAGQKYKGVTGDDGILTFKDVYVGTYDLIEVATQGNVHELNPPVEIYIGDKTVDDTDGGTTQTTQKDNPMPLKTMLTKTNLDGTKLEGAQFSIDFGNLEALFPFNGEVAHFEMIRESNAESTLSAYNTEVHIYTTDK